MKQYIERLRAGHTVLCTVIVAKGDQEYDISDCL